MKKILFVIIHILAIGMVSFMLLLYVLMFMEFSCKKENQTLPVIPKVLVEVGNIIYDQKTDTKGNIVEQIYRFSLKMTNKTSSAVYISKKLFQAPEVFQLGFIESSSRYPAITVNPILPGVTASGIVISANATVTANSYQLVQDDSKNFDVIVVLSSTATKDDAKLKMVKARLISLQIFSNALLNEGKEVIILTPSDNFTSINKPISSE